MAAFAVVMYAAGHLCLAAVCIARLLVVCPLLPPGVSARRALRAALPALCPALALAPLRGALPAAAAWAAAALAALRGVAAPPPALAAAAALSAASVVAAAAAAAADGVAPGGELSGAARAVLVACDLAVVLVVAFAQVAACWRRRDYNAILLPIDAERAAVVAQPPPPASPLHALAAAAAFLGSSQQQQPHRATSGTHTTAAQQQLQQLATAAEDQALLPPDAHAASALGLLYFHWINPLVVAGRERTLETEDMPRLAKRLRSEHAGSCSFAPAWDAERARPHRRLMLWRALGKTFGVQLFLGGFLKLMNDCCVFLSPWILRRIILHLQIARLHPDTPHVLWDGLLLAASLMLVYALQSLFFNHYFGNNVEVQVQVAGALVTSVYAKSCKLSPDARAKFTSGFISNLMATDARVLADLTLYLNTLWSGIEQILVALAMLIGLLGWMPTLAGVMVVLCSVPVQGRLVAIVKQTRERASSWTDERVKIVSEALSGIRVVKLYAWESSFLKRILDARLGELKPVRHALLVQALSSSLVSAIPTGLSLATFGTFVVLGGRLDAALVFPAIALFNVLRPPMLILPNVMINVARSAAAASRIEKFLLADEIIPLAVGPHAIALSEFEASGCDIIAHNASFAWDPQLAKSVGPTLSGVDLRIPAGSLVCVLGQTACGKSTMLEAFLGEVPIMSGRAGIRQDAKVAFCHQVPFIQNATLRQNILFGQPLDMERYRRVLRVCCLIPDLKVLPAGDMTEIGGRGINLSGGQRARVSLARAVYSESEVVLLDSPLAAVDAHVARSIFENCIVGELGGRTRLMTTNHVNFASSSSVDFVAIVRDGVLVEFGQRAALQTNERSLFVSLLASQASSRQDSAARSEACDAENVVESLMPADMNISMIDDVHKTSQKVSSFQDGIYMGEDVDRVRAKTLSRDEAGQGQLVHREGKSTGRVAIKHYVQYLRAVGGYHWVLLIFGCSCCSQVLNISVNVWLSIWSGAAGSGSASDALGSVGKNLTVYTILSVGAIAAQSTAEFSLAFASIRASVWMHEKLCVTVFRAPLSFFDETPIGRIINRFNASVDKIDNSLAATLQSVTRMVLSLVATFALISYSTPWFLAVVVIAAACFLYVQEFYRKTAVDLRRIESVTRSPLYSHFGETLDGVVTLRAYGSIPRAIGENRAHTDLNVSVVYVSAGANRWLSVRLELLAASMIFAAATLAVTSYKVVSPEMSGLVLSYAMQTVSSLGWAVRQVTEAESQMSAVEQISEYSTVPPFPQEEELEKFNTEQAADEDEANLRRSESFGLVSNMLVQHIVRGRRRVRQTRWPRRGLVRFENVTMRYRPGLEPALRGINLTIEPGWHVGIVGRTGAGKTSLIGTLFRLQEIEEGRIEIDGQDISKMRLIDLRSSLSVIAQEAVLFSGTIRSNLDMAGIYDDSAVSRAFRSCGLRETSAGDLTLDTVVSENGSNFSVGQRQLICLGRALLRDSMVLVLDEATASLDDWTDHKMGETLRTEMGHCTIIVIAHRLHTVMRCDRVCVLDQGRVVEFGAPNELLSRKAGSLFADLVDETGPATASYLRRLADAPAVGNQSTLSPSRSPAMHLRIDDSKEKEALLDRTRAALKLLRSSVVELDSPEWTAELQRTNSDVDEWRSTLLSMITSLADLASSRLGVLCERRMNGFCAEALQLDALNPEDERLVDGTVSPAATGVVRPPRNAGGSG